jgi:hypothetical protein
MKKLFGKAIVAFALFGLLFASCASTKSAGTESVHPRDYTFDLIDSGEVCDIVFNQYGPNYQAKCDFTSFVKKDKPQAGDTVYIKARAVSDTDLPVLFGCLVDPSQQAGYWKQLEEYTTIAEDVVAGVPFDLDFTFVLTASPIAEFTFMIQYDTVDQPQPLINKPARLTFERVCESTDTRIGVPVAPHNPYVTIDLNDAAAFCEMATEYPWINGVQDMSVVENYKCRPEVTNYFEDDLPVVGDKVHIIWHAKADKDISKICFYLIDNSEKCAWWMPLSDIENAPYIENIKAGEVFDVDLDIPVTVNAVQKVTVIIQYDPGAATPDGPCFIKRVNRE